MIRPARTLRAYLAQGAVVRPGRPTQYARGGSYPGKITPGPIGAGDTNCSTVL